MPDSQQQNTLKVSREQRERPDKMEDVWQNWGSRQDLEQDTGASNSESEGWRVGWYRVTLALQLEDTQVLRLIIL